MFVIAFICVGVSVTSAKNSSSSENSVNVSKRLLAANPISNKIKARCKADDCGQELSELQNINDIYEGACAPNYLGSCEPGLAGAVIRAGERYEACLNSPYQAKNIDRTMDRKNIEKTQISMSK